MSDKYNNKDFPTNLPQNAELLPRHLNYGQNRVLSDEDRIIGQRIRNERIALELTQEQLSNALGISISYLSCLERGYRSVSSFVLKKLHSYFNLSYDYILEGKSPFDVNYAQFLRENDSLDTYNKMLVLLQTCTEGEIETCYRICHSFLISNRKNNNNARKKW